MITMRAGRQDARTEQSKRDLQSGRKLTKRGTERAALGPTSLAGLDMTVSIERQICLRPARVTDEEGQRAAPRRDEAPP